MRRKRAFDTPMSADERALVARIAAHYRPGPMTPARQVAFRAAIERRQRRGRRGAWGAAAVALAATALLVAWLNALPPAPESASSRHFRRDAAQQALIDPDAYESEAEGLLPEEYLVLARVLHVPVEDL
jgi:hypothetical protein